MKDIIEQLQEEIEADTDLSFTASEGKSGSPAETEPNNGTQPSNDNLSPP